MAGGAVVAGGGGGNPFKTGFITRPYLPAFILVTSLFFLWGFAYGLLDVLNKKFQTVLGVSKLESTGLQVMYFGVGYLLYSPVAGEILKRKGYKITILSGLFLYSLGAILFWPVAKFSIGTTNPNAIFGGFLICTGVIACGLATLEVSANSYVSVLPPVNVANFRLQFSQSFNGVASFTGPLIASKYFFSEENANDLTNVQWVYLAVSAMGAIIAAAFVFTKIPEVSEQELEERAEAVAFAQGREGADIGPFWKQTRAITGFVAQFLYVGAQVTIGTFFLNYTHDAAGINDQQGAQLLSYALICFTVARFICTALLSVISAPVLLAFCAAMATLMVVLIGSLHGMGGVVCLILIMGFESLMYPVIFVLGTANLGRHTRRAAGLLVMGVAGGAAFPPMQGAIAVAYNTRVSFFICVPCFLYITLWAVWIWNKDGRHFLVRTEQAALAQLTVSQGEIPPAHVGLNHKGEAIGNYEPSIKDEVERVEKA